MGAAFAPDRAWSPGKGLLVEPLDASQAQRERLAFLELRAFFTGELRRSDIEARFGIKPAASSRDLALYREVAPGNLEYDAVGRCYRPSGSFEPVFPFNSDRVMAWLLQGYRFDRSTKERVAHEAIRKAEVLLEAQNYLRTFRDKLTVIKLGGSTLDNQRDALEDIVWLQGLGAQPVLVHGAWADASSWDGVIARLQADGFTAIAAPNPSGAFNPVPTAVPPCASSISIGMVISMRLMPFSTCLA